MKNKWILGLILVPFAAAGQQESYTIKGKAGNYTDPAKVYLIYQEEGRSAVDSSALKNGTFEFAGKLSEPFSAVMVMDHAGVGLASLDPQGKNDVLGIYIDKGLTTIQSADSLYKSKISGSPLNSDNQKLQELLKPIGAKVNALNAEWAKATVDEKSSEAFKENFMQRYEAIQNEQNQLLKSFIKSHPESFVSLDALKALAGPDPNYSEIEPLFSGLNEKLRQTGSGQALAAVLNRNKYTAVGSIAADFTQNDPSGKPVKLSDFRGKYVLLDFWASWCGPCRVENPNLVRVFNKYKDKNFTILGVSLDRGKEAWLQAVKDDKLSWTQVSDLKYWNNEAAKQYGVQSIPQNFLLDPSGKIIAKNLRGEELDRALADIIK